MVGSVSVNAHVEAVRYGLVQLKFNVQGTGNPVAGMRLAQARQSPRPSTTSSPTAMWKYKKSAYGNLYEV